MADRLYQVKTSYLCCGIVTNTPGYRAERVVEAAPIMKWSLGKPLSEIIRFIGRKNGTVTQVLSTS